MADTQTATAVTDDNTTKNQPAEGQDGAPQPEDRSHDTSGEDRSQNGRSGHLRVEDRTAAPPPRGVEERIIESMRAVEEGENRSLTDPTLGLVAAPELSTRFWDLLRPQSVVLESGVTVLTTDRQSVEFPRQTADPAVAFYNELDSITESDPVFDSLTVTPKAIKGLVRGSSEAFEDSSPDLLTLLQANLQKVMALKLDATLLFGDVTSDAKSFNGLDKTAGVASMAWGGATNYDPILKAVGYLAGAHVPPPYHLIAHPWALTALSLIKKLTGTIQSNEGLEVPDGVPDRSSTTLIPTTGTAPNLVSTMYVYAPAQVVFVRRRDVTIEVDRSQEFTSDSVLVRSKLRGAVICPYPQAIVKITGAPTPNPST